MANLYIFSASSATVKTTSDTPPCPNLNCLDVCVTIQQRVFESGYPRFWEFSVFVVMNCPVWWRGNQVLWGLEVCFIGNVAFVLLLLYCSSHWCTQHVHFVLWCRFSRTWSQRTVVQKTLIHMRISWFWGKGICGQIWFLRATMNLARVSCRPGEEIALGKPHGRSLGRRLSESGCSQRITLVWSPLRSSRGAGALRRTSLDSTIINATLPKQILVHLQLSSLWFFCVWSESCDRIFHIFMRSWLTTWSVASPIF